MNSCYNFSKYIETTSRPDQKPFFKNFLQMQMFTRFLERKMWAQKQEDVIDILMFDESIRIKKLRKRGMLGIKRVSSQP